VRHAHLLLVLSGLALGAQGAYARVATDVTQPPGLDDIAPGSMSDFDWEELAQQNTTTPPAPATPPPVVQPAPATTAPVVPPPAVTPPPAPATTEPLPQVTPPTTDQPAASEPPAPETLPDGGAMNEDFSLGDIPIVETVELNALTARKALDAYVLVREKYKDAELENYENLQDFVDQAAQGKAFEADIKAAGFANVNEWNIIITTLSFAFDNSIDDQTADVKQQITELQADTEMAQDMRDRMIAALNAMIPSPNNKKVLEDMSKDAAYSEKVKILATETETEQ
jgi:hypothetical protein